MERVRLARSDELARLREVERAAGRLFAEVGRHDVAAHEPPSVEQLAAYQRDGRAWVAVDDGDVPVGYALAEELDGVVHLQQLSVDPRHGRRGRGRALVEAVCTWAAGRGAPAVTLTTFRDVPWNGPYYERLGFRTLSDDELTPALRAVRAHEAELGLDPRERVVMRRPQASPGLSATVADV